MNFSTLFLLSLAFGGALTDASPVERKRLIKTSEADPGVWMEEAEILKLTLSGVPFVDITSHRDFSLKKKADVHAIPTNPTHQEIVNRLIPLSSRTRLEDFVRTFSDFFNRHYQSDFGVESETWLLSQVESSLAGYNGTVSVREVSHSWRQNSVIARIEGVDPMLKSEVVVLGAHQDSIAGTVNDTAPGADDNATGSSVVLEALRILVEAGFRPKRTIDFHWYAAEEAGLLGSADIAKEYKEGNVTVVAMLNLDVIGYQPPNTTEIAIYTDNGSDELIAFTRVLVDEYLDFTYRSRSCGYGCSDHASWTNNGYASVFAARPEGDGNSHTPNDTFEKVGFQQVLEFVKLAIGFAVEISES